MICKECGKIINDNEELCPFCHKENIVENTLTSKTNDIDKLFQETLKDKFIIKKRRIFK